MKRQRPSILAMVKVIHDTFAPHGVEDVARRAVDVISDPASIIEWSTADIQDSSSLVVMKRSRNRNRLVISIQSLAAVGLVLASVHKQANVGILFAPQIRGPQRRMVLDSLQTNYWHRLAPFFTFARPSRIGVLDPKMRDRDRPGGVLRLGMVLGYFPRDARSPHHSRCCCCAYDGLRLLTVTQWRRLDKTRVFPPRAGHNSIYGVWDLARHLESGGRP